MKRCASCYWFQETDERVPDGPFKGDKTGECWFAPPQLIIGQQAPPGAGLLPGRISSQSVRMGMSPPTYESRRCHEWTSRKELAN